MDKDGTQVKVQTSIKCIVCGAIKAVRKDINLWIPKVKKGGFLCGDDYEEGDHPGVMQAVDRVFKEKSLIYTHERFWIHAKHY